MLKISTCFLAFLLVGLQLFAKDYTLLSPDKKVKVLVSVTDKITWSVLYETQVLTQPSQLALALENNITFGKNPVLTSEKRSSKDEMLTAVNPVKSRLVRDQYNDLVLTFKGDYKINFRAYNEGAAYRFESSLKEANVNVLSETANFNFSDNYRVFWPQETDTSFQSHFENIFIDTSIASFNSNEYGNMPMLLQTSNGISLFITEADLYDYPNLFLFGTGGNGVTAGFPKVIDSLRPRGDRGNRITKLSDFIAKTTGTRTYPWRIIGIASEDKKLLENNLVYKLSTRSVLQDVSWIKPGKVAWDWWNFNNIYGVDFKAGVNTNTYKYFIDFASAFGLEYIMLDEGWSRTTTDVLHPKSDIDVEELVKYGATKKVAVLLWTLWGPLDKDMDNILDQFVKWGVKGIKVDFMARADQYMVNYYERVAIAAARRKLMVDLHGAYKPVGLHKKYPNVISYEGVRGAENNKWEETITPKHNATLPFTRMVAGPMDYTPGAMINAGKESFRSIFNEPMSMGTRAHQASMYVLYESPWQMLADNPTNYWRDTTFTRFIAGIPTTWDTTIALQAKAGEYLAVARKHGNNWYVGAMTDFSKRSLTLPLDFLDTKKYTMTFVADGINADRHAADYTIKKKVVGSGETINIDMEKGGGWAAIFVPLIN